MGRVANAHTHSHTLVHTNTHTHAHMHARTQKRIHVTKLKRKPRKTSKKEVDDIIYDGWHWW